MNNRLKKKRSNGGVPLNYKTGVTHFFSLSMETVHSGEYSLEEGNYVFISPFQDREKNTEYKLRDIEEKAEKLSEQCWKLIFSSLHEGLPDSNLENSFDKIVRRVADGLGSGNIRAYKEHAKVKESLKSLFGYLICLSDLSLLEEITFSFEKQEKENPKIAFLIKKHGTLRAVLETPSQVRYTWVSKSEFAKGMPSKQGVFRRTKHFRNSIYILDLIKDILKIW